MASDKDNAPLTPGVLSWLMDLRQVSDAVQKTKSKRSTSQKTRLFYLLSPEAPAGLAGISLLKGLRPEQARPWNNVDRALIQPPQFVEDSDLPILRLLWAGRNFLNTRYPFRIQLEQGAELLDRLLETGRLLSSGPEFHPLTEGATRPALVRWQPDGQGRQLPRVISTPPADLMLPTDPPWYVDFRAGQAGRLSLDLAAPVLRKLMAMPPLLPREAEVVAEILSEIAPNLPVPKADVDEGLRIIDLDPLPCLRLETFTVDAIRAWRDYPPEYGPLLYDYAQPAMRYGEVLVVPGDGQEYVPLLSGEIVRVLRRPEREAQYMESLKEAGFRAVPSAAIYCFGERPQGMFGLPSLTAWENFMTERVPLLEKAGWVMVYAPKFRHHFLSVEAWEAEIHEQDDESADTQGGGWFSLDMGIVVDGRRLPLAPLLSDLFGRDGRWLDAFQLADIPETERVVLITPEEQQIRVPAGRLKPLARLLIDLFDNSLGLPGGVLRLSKLDAPRLAELEGRERWQFKGMDAVQAMANRIQGGQGIQSVTPPAGLALSLRTYQIEGLAWLQFLREQGLSGILADDMGLGKTAQTLAHLLLEKEAGRGDRPSLIVLPTSLIYNWSQEAARFAPGLRVLNLHGLSRKSLFEEIPSHDLVLTTYSLLWRDAEFLAEHLYHYLILDEAQMVKNAQSRSAGVVRRLKSRHRLCLTGTPLENHLGELWSQFDFLLPGFLDGQREFTRYWRNPIEKQGDVLRRDLLVRRLRPFILRRRKEDVAQELPPKTIIVRTVPLTGGQRDLYETVRAAMDSRVRAEIASRGLQGSQIVILDALLKLRQVCCDPRLVKSPVARRVREKAKLDQLMDMLPELVEEGRRILLFSQFTSMLDLIQDELKAVNLPFVRLSGETQDRRKPIERFQAGEVPIFLISLKAGGVGLNLTAADTVIHYDPWWNPAVENQATDRAHRIGQDKPVFVYKLIVAGSIEERILALQARKAELAAGILSDDRQVSLKFGEDDLAALFEPLPLQ